MSQADGGDDLEDGGDGAGAGSPGGGGSSGEGIGAPAGYPVPLRPGEVMRLVLPAFAVSTLLAVVGVILVVTGHRTVGIVIVVIAAVGGIFYRARVLVRAQQQRQPPEG